MKRKLKAVLILAFMVASVIMLSGCVEEEAPVSTPSPTSTPIPKTTPTPEAIVTLSDIRVPEYDSTLVRNYEIVETEDISIKVMDKPLSAYSTSQYHTSRSLHSGAAPDGRILTRLLLPAIFINNISSRIC